MNIYKSAFVFLLFSTFIACQNTPPQYNGQKTAYFDLKSYFKTEIARLKHDGQHVKKTVTLNGKSEEKVLDSLNFEEELAPFLASDINRPAWSDYYMSKTVPLQNVSGSAISNNGEMLEYYALKDHLKTRSIVVEKSNTDMKVNILNAEETIATKAETRLTYDNRTGYTIATVQKLMGTEDTVKVNVQFLQR
jgi:hypothetical protein